VILLMEMTSPQVAQYIASGKDAIIIPVGSCEQHGPHCPLGTDTFITQETAMRIARHLGIIVAPMVGAGVSDQHLNWPGTISLRGETVQFIIRDYLESLTHHGFKTFILFFFHTKNKIPVDAAAWELKRTFGPKIKVLVVNSFAAWQSCAPEIFGSGSEIDHLWLSHGGQGETSCMRHLGYSIDPDQIPERYVPADFIERSRSTEVYEIIQDLAAYAPDGVWGEPGKGSAALGQRIFETVSSRLAGLIRKLLHPEPQSEN
jgi:creatinine amidohydrolase